jgi:membrane protease YdiL (CAAX protease family)
MALTLIVPGFARRLASRLSGLAWVIASFMGFEAALRLLSWAFAGRDLALVKWLCLTALVLGSYHLLSRRLPRTDLVARPWPWVGSALLGLAVAAVLVTGVLTYAAVHGRLLRASSPPLLWQPAWTAFLLCFAVTEEVLCRGVMLRVLAQHMSLPWAATVQALVFSALHLIGQETFYLIAFVSHTVFGLMMALLVLRTGRLLPAILMHLISNLLIASLENRTSSVDGGWGVASGVRLEIAEFVDLPLARLVILVALLAILAWWSTPRRQRTRAQPATS